MERSTPVEEVTSIEKNPEIKKGFEEINEIIEVIAKRWNFDTFSKINIIGLLIIDFVGANTNLNFYLCIDCWQEY